MDKGSKEFTLTIKRPDGSSHLFCSGLPVVRVGSDAGNDLVLREQGVASHHLVLMERNGSVEAVALGNDGFFFDGKPVKRAILKQNQEITLSKIRIHVGEETPDVAQAEEDTDLERELDRLLDPDPPTVVNQEIVTRAPLEERSTNERRVEGVHEEAPAVSDMPAGAIFVDEDEDEDDWPAYDLQRSHLFADKRPSHRTGPAYWEVLRYSGDVVFATQALRRGRRYRPDGEEDAIARLNRKGQLEIAAIPDMEVSSDPTKKKFKPVTADGNGHWLMARGESFTLRLNGVSYYFRKNFDESLYLRPQKKELDSTSIHIAGFSTWLHLAIIAILSVFSPSIADVSAAKLPPEDLQRFVDIAMKDLKKEEAPKPKPTPPPQKPVVAKKKKATPKKVKRVVKRRARPSKRAVARAKPRKAKVGQVADITQVGALGKLGGLGLFGKTPASRRKLVAAASNVHGIRSHGNVKTFRVSAAMAALPGKEVRLAKVSNMKKLGGTAKGDGFGVATVGRKRSQKVKGVVVDVEPPPFTISIKGGLTREEIAKVVQENVSAIRYCYEKSLLDDPGLSGKIVLNWTIARSGSVSKSGIRSSTVRNSSVHRCLVGEVRGWRFPKPRDSGVVLVSYPFVFNNASF